MSELQKINDKELMNMNDIEKCIFFEQDSIPETAANAATELAAKDMEIAALKKNLATAQKTAIYFFELGHGVRPSITAMRFIKIYKKIHETKGGE